MIYRSPFETSSRKSIFLLRQIFIIIQFVNPFDNTFIIQHSKDTESIPITLMDKFNSKIGYCLVGT
jgi:hypothetical protein